MKVLVISHNPICTFQNMGKTMLSMFSELKPEELCQLYIYPSIPNVPACSSFYRITDKDVLRFYWSFRVCGREIRCDESVGRIFENEVDEQIYRNPKNKQPVRMLARDMMWKCSRWYHPQLRKWLQTQMPTVIFVAPGSAKFLYEIARKIAEERNIPIVTYVCDDYYFASYDRSLAGKMQSRLLKRKISQFMGSTAHLVTICDEMNEKYTDCFGLKATTLMTGSQTVPAGYTEKENISVLSYFGNIRGGRHHSLVQIGQALDAINSEFRTNHQLRIYSMEKNDGVLGVFSGISSVVLSGFVSGEAYEKAVENTDILIHSEGFDAASVEKVRYSVSTKIADSLASGIPLLAYGPENVASMAHLIRNDCAIVATSKEDLLEALKTALFDGDRRRTVSENAMQTAKKYHQKEQNSRKLRQILELVQENHCHE